MNKFTGLMAVTLIAMALPGQAFADAEKGQSYLSVMGSYVDDDADRGLEDEINGGQISLGYAMSKSWNFEAMVSFANFDDGAIPSVSDQDHRGLGIDLQRVFRRSATFSPYLHIGVGRVLWAPDNAPHDNGTMYSAGAGFLLDIFGDRTALRGEWRHRIDDATGTDLSDDVFSLGLQIPFGAKKAKFIDTDGDGVADSMDRCPNTPVGTAVDAYGCERDSDNDGVKDSMDQCPGTPSGVKVDATGCPVDSDGDGVSDDKDNCPGTPAGAAVDAAGCELDGDNDGVVDRLDECPDSAAGVQVDIKGCEIKEEIALQGVNFESNSDRLLPGATSVLDDAAATLRKNPSIKVEVAGHTDSDGAAAHNESLSTRRATTVHDFLVANGVTSDRMSARGYGESQPVADNATAAGKAQNRRVVLRIVER